MSTTKHEYTAEEERAGQESKAIFAALIRDREDAFFEAVSRDNVDRMKKLMDSCLSVINAHIFGVTPLHYAVKYNSKEAAKLLLPMYMDIEFKDSDGSTPLHWAAKYNRKEIAELLLARGANKEARDSSGLIPLDVATSCKYPGRGSKYAFVANKKEMMKLLTP